MTDDVGRKQYRVVFSIMPRRKPDGRWVWLEHVLERREVVHVTDIPWAKARHRIAWSRWEVAAVGELL